MGHMKTFTLAALLGLACALPASQVASAEAEPGFLEYLNSDPSQYIFHPIEGMPTLEDLNVTVADFLDPAYRAANGLDDPRSSSPVARSPIAGLEKRFDPVCFDISLSAHIQAAYACRDYLNSLGSTPCIVRGSNTRTMNCYMDVQNVGYARVYGMPAYPLNYAQSSCADVARGMQWVIDSCVSNNPCRCGVTGQNAANGNGNYIVSVTNN